MTALAFKFKQYRVVLPFDQRPRHMHPIFKASLQNKYSSHNWRIASMTRSNMRLHVRISMRWLSICRKCS